MADRPKAKLELKYEELERDGAPVRVFSAVCPQAGMHFWVQDTDDAARRILGQRHFGGLEIHYRKPTGYRQNEPPDNEDCWLLGGPCWHDGSSLAAEEIWIPKWRSYIDRPELVLCDLAYELRSAIEELEEPADD